MHNPRTIANEFIELSDGLTLQHLWHLSYMAHGFCLGILEKPLADEYVQAWEWGPIFPSIYYEFISEKPGFIKNQSQTVMDGIKGKVLVNYTSNFDKNEKRIVEFVFKSYSKVKTWQLYGYNKKEGSPWHQTWEKAGGIRGLSISNEVIKKYYQNLLKL